MKAQILKSKRTKAKESNAPLYIASAIFGSIILIGIILDALGLLVEL